MNCRKIMYINTFLTTFLLVSTIVVSVQSCCSSKSSGNKLAKSEAECIQLGGEWKWTPCVAPETCQSYQCTVTGAGITWSTIMYQNCFTNETYKTSMSINSQNSYTCTSSALPLRFGTIHLEIAAVFTFLIMAGN